MDAANYFRLREIHAVMVANLKGLEDQLLGWGIYICLTSCLEVVTWGRMDQVGGSVLCQVACEDKRRCITCLSHVRNIGAIKS